MGLRLGALTIRWRSWNQSRVDVKVMAIKADIDTLKKEVAKLKSIDITSLWGSMDVRSEVATSVTSGLGLRESTLSLPQRMTRDH